MIAASGQEPDVENAKITLAESRTPVSWAPAESAVSTGKD